jgi:hypothetical protein
METMTHDEWTQKGKDLFGKKPEDWKFKCVSCGTVQSIQDFIDAGLVRKDAIAAAYQECIGRHVKDKGCDWALYGLFKIHELEVTHNGSKIPVLKFAE